MIIAICTVVILSILLILFVSRVKTRKKNYIVSGIGYGGIGNRLFGVSSNFLLSILANRHFHCIISI